MIILARFAGIGDALFVNTIAFLKGVETGKKIWIATNHKEVFNKNPYVNIIPVQDKKKLNLILKILKLSRIKYEYTYLDYYPLKGEHILSILSKKINLATVPNYPIYCGDLSITCLPKNIIEFFYKQSNKKIVLIQSGSNTSWTKNKAWYSDRFRQLSSAIFEDCTIVHIGVLDDPDIQSHIDLRSKLKISQLFSLLKNADLFIGTVGFLMHAAASVKTRSLIIYGGFEAPWESGYTQNINIYSPIDCAPCWKTVCTHQIDKYCMDIISADRIISEVKQLI